MDHYLVTTAMAGYLPESDPYVIDCDPDRASVPQILEVIADHVNRACDGLDFEAEPGSDERIEADKWAELLDEIEADRENAANLDPSGFHYSMPDDYYIEAHLETASALIGLGYNVDLDGHDFEAAGLVDPEREPVALRAIDASPFSISADELRGAVEALAYRDAYGLDDA